MESVNKTPSGMLSETSPVVKTPPPFKQCSWNLAPQMCIIKQNDTLRAVAMTTILPLVLSQ